MRGERRGKLGNVFGKDSTDNRADLGKKLSQTGLRGLPVLVLGAGEGQHSHFEELLSDHYLFEARTET